MVEHRHTHTHTHTFLLHWAVRAKPAWRWGRFPGHRSRESEREVWRSRVTESWMAEREVWRSRETERWMAERERAWSNCSPAERREVPVLTQDVVVCFCLVGQHVLPLLLLLLFNINCCLLVSRKDPQLVHITARGLCVCVCVSCRAEKLQHLVTTD